MNLQASIGNMSQGKLPTFQEESAFEKLCPNLTFQQRMMGFAGCFGIGWLLSLMVGGKFQNNVLL
jgi:hypothetical protein